jgi:hypothetical protein
LAEEGASLVQETSSKAREHRLRVLEHQARNAAECGPPPPPRADAQGKMPLLVEVRAREVERRARTGRSRGKATAKQDSFEGL